jgi:hypothetical protein
MVDTPVRWQQSRLVPGLGFLGSGVPLPRLGPTYPTRSWLFGPTPDPIQENCRGTVERVHTQPTTPTVRRLNDGREREPEVQTPSHDYRAGCVWKPSEVSLNSCFLLPYSLCDVVNPEMYTSPREPSLLVGLEPDPRVRGIRRVPSLCSTLGLITQSPSDWASITSSSAPILDPPCRSPQKRSSPSSPFS